MPRPRCARCQRPLSVCCCAELVGALAPVDLLVLQHPSEVKKAVGTVRLLALGYRNCRVEVGESFADAPWLEALLDEYRGRTWVLFPRADATPVEALPRLEPPHGVKEDAARPLVIVLDGTWRKAQKIAHLNAWLATVPAIALAPEVPSRYRIRKAPRADSLSTLEAVVALLREWQNSADEGQMLLDAFEAMIARQIEAMGEATFRDNYADRTPQG